MMNDFSMWKPYEQEAQQAINKFDGFNPQNEKIAYEITLELKRVIDENHGRGTFSKFLKELSAAQSANTNFH